LKPIVRELDVILTYKIDAGLTLAGKGGSSM